MDKRLILTAITITSVLAAWAGGLAIYYASWMYCTVASNMCAWVPAGLAY